MTVKTVVVTSVRRDMGPHGRFRGEWVKAKRIVSMYYTSPSYKTIRWGKGKSVFTAVSSILI